MEARVLNVEEKKACIAFMIALLINKAEQFICHCFSEFIGSESDMALTEMDSPEDYMHIIFPELYNELKSLVEDDTEMLRYNKNNSRMGDDFGEDHKCPVWYSGEYEDRIDFLNDLNDMLK